MKHVAFALFAAVTLLLISCGSDLPSQMPDIQLTDVYGNNVSAASLTDGDHPVMLSFYATWCDPCTKELNEIAPLYASWQEQFGVQLIIVSIDKYPAQIPNVVQSVEEHGWERFGLLFDSNGELMRALEVETIPTVFFIDPSGRIVHKTVGYDKDSVANAERYLKEMTLPNSPSAKP